MLQYIKEWNKNNLCSMTDHIFILADRTCTADECEKNRQCCSICFQKKLHHDCEQGRRIYLNTTIEMIIQQHKIKYEDQLDDLYADYYYECLIHQPYRKTQQIQEYLQQMKKKMKQLKQILSKFSYQDYHWELKEQNLGLFLFLEFKKKQIEETILAIKQIFQEFRSKSIALYEIDDTFDQIFMHYILKKIIKRKKYLNRRFSQGEQERIQQNIDKLNNIDYQLGQSIKQLKSSLLNKFQVQQFIKLKKFGLLEQQSQVEYEQLQDIEKQLELNPNNHQLYYQKALILWGNKQVKQAIENFQIAIDLNPQYIFFQCLGLIHQDEFMDNEQAIFYYQKAISLNSTQIELYLLKGSALRALSQIEEEIQLYYQALEIDQNNLKLYQQLECFEICEKAEQVWTKIEFYKNEDDPNKTENQSTIKQLYIIQAQVLEKNNQYLDAKKICKLALKKFKYEIQFYKLKGICLIKLNEKQDSVLKFFQRVIEIFPEEQFEVNQLQGVYFFQKKNFQLAYKFFKKQIDLNPQNIIYYHQFGIKDKYDQAIAILEDAIKEIPEYEEFSEQLDQIQLLKNQQENSFLIYAQNQKKKLYAQQQNKTDVKLRMDYPKKYYKQKSQANNNYIQKQKIILNENLKEHVVKLSPSLNKDNQNGQSYQYKKLKYPRENNNATDNSQIIERNEQQIQVDQNINQFEETPTPNDDDVSFFESQQEINLDQKLLNGGADCQSQQNQEQENPNQIQPNISKKKERLINFFMKLLDNGSQETKL